MCRYQSNTEKRNCVEIPPLGVRGLATCGNGPSYFVYLTSSYTNLLSYLRDGSETNTATVRMNYCKPSENLFGNLNEDKPYQVTGSIVSTQNIGNGYVVRYKAGSFIELNPGFVSGTNFVAEINPCSNNVTVIAAKTDDIVENLSRESFQSLDNYNAIKIYPTVLASESGINIETLEATEILDVIMYDIQGKQVKSFILHNLLARTPTHLYLDLLPPNFYFLKAIGKNCSITQKIIIE